jgi:hypothetical protein
MAWDGRLKASKTWSRPCLRLRKCGEYIYLVICTNLSSFISFRTRFLFMHRPRQKSSSSARSDISDHSFLSTSSSASPRSTPSLPSPFVYGTLLSPADTPHKRDRFKTLFFTPSIRDSGISLSAPTSDPRFPSPLTPPCFPIPGIPIHEEALVKDELDFLVDELAARYACYDSRDSACGLSDRCDSPTLDRPSVTMASRSRSPMPMREQSNRNSNSKTKSHTSTLPGASHLNLPVSPSTSGITPTSISSHPETLSPARSKPAINLCSPLLNLPHLFRCLAITDPHINGQPIRFLSQDFVHGANSLQVGSCTFMNLPYGAEVECGLRVEPSFPRSASKAQTVMLQIVQRVVRVRDGSSVWLLCSEVDVSSQFTAQVRGELAAAASTHTPHTGKKQQASIADDIWVSLAQQLGTDSYAPSTTRLPTHKPTADKSENTTPVLSDLLSLLTEVRFLHRQFFILQPKATKTGELGLKIPYLSSSLHTSLLSLPSKPINEHTKQETSHGLNTSIYTTNLEATTPLGIFIATASLQARTWVGTSTQTPTILRGILSLPPMGRGKETKEEQIGVYGVRVAESWADGRQGSGCWVCFLVPQGVEKEI